MNTALYDKLNSGALAFERDAGVASVTGPDRVGWLQGMVSNDVGHLKPGDGCYAAHLTPQGKIVSQMLVLAEEETLWLEMERDNVDRTVEALNKLLIMEDAEIVDRSADFGVLAVVGSEARRVLEGWSGVPLDLTVPYAHASAGEARVVRTDLGYDLIVPAGRVSGVYEALTRAGAGAGDRETWEVLRIESGLPVYGIDCDSSTTLPELGEKGIDFQKGCYIGQEVVAKIRYIGHVNRRLVGLTLTGDKHPEPNARLRRDDREIGRITSSAYSPAVGSTIALGFVRLGAEGPGTELEVTIDNASCKATVTDLPFVSRSCD